MNLVFAKCPRCGCSLLAEPDDTMPYCETCIELVIHEQVEDREDPLPESGGTDPEKPAVQP